MFDTRASTSADASPPFAADDDRLRLVYALPLLGTERRVLVFGSPDDVDPLLRCVPPGATTEVGHDLEQIGEACFDAVLLPLALFGARAQGLGSAPPEALPRLLRRVHQSLRPGGILVGHVENVLSIATVRTVVRGNVQWTSWLRCRGAWSAGSCLSMLGAAGFEAPECYFVEPRILAPMTLVPFAGRPARAHFTRAIRRTRSSYTAAGYLIRLMVAWAGLGGSLQPHLFFWARRPC